MRGPEKIAELLLADVPKDLLLEVQARFEGAMKRAAELGRSAASGHKSHVIGVNRHFLLNEAFDGALTEFGIPHSPVKGNAIVVGRVGRVNMARLHRGGGEWDNCGRSAGKRKLAKINAPVGRWLQPDMLDNQEITVSEVTAFMISEHNGQVDSETQIYIVVTDENFDLKNPLFKEDVAMFLQRYERAEPIVDKAHPTLKVGVIKKRSDK